MGLYLVRNKSDRQVLAVIRADDEAHLWLKFDEEYFDPRQTCEWIKVRSTVDTFLHPYLPGESMWKPFTDAGYKRYFE